MRWKPNWLAVALPMLASLILAQTTQPLAAAAQVAANIDVEPRATPSIPEGRHGIAARYPGDVGIENDPDVIFVETFEGSVDDICSRWETVEGRSLMTTSEDIVPGSGGKQSLLLTRVVGGTEGYRGGGSLYRRLRNASGGFGYEQLYFRFYMKFNAAHAPIHHYGSGIVGYYPPTPWPQGGAGERPDGTKRWTTQVEPGDFGSWDYYCYWQEMGGNPPRGQTWGNSFERGVTPRAAIKDQWICLEVMVKMNDIGDSNGEQAYWLDGRLSRNSSGAVTSYLGKGFPNSGVWTFDKFAPYRADAGVTWDPRKRSQVTLPGGRPFPGFRWRNIPELNANAIWLYRYMSQPERGTSKVWWDHLVVAKKYIGPLTPTR